MSGLVCNRWFRSAVFLIGTFIGVAVVSWYLLGLGDRTQFQTLAADHSKVIAHQQGIYWGCDGVAYDFSVNGTDYETCDPNGITGDEAGTTLPPVTVTYNPNDPNVNCVCDPVSELDRVSRGDATTSVVAGLIGAAVCTIPLLLVWPIKREKTLQ